MKHQKVTILSTVAVLVAITALLMPGQMTEIIAEEKEGYKAANGVVIKTYFKPNGEILDSDFQVYKQLPPNNKLQKNFASSNGAPMFLLEGVVNEDRAFLYEAADQAFLHGTSFRNDFPYSEVDIRIVLEKEGIPLREFAYDRCRVHDYTVETLFDKEEGWFGKGFATVDKFKFQCQGYHPLNPLMDFDNSHEEADTISSMDLIAEQEKLSELRNGLRK